MFVQRCFAAMLATSALMLAGCERAAKAPDPTTPGQDQPRPSGIAEVYLRVTLGDAPTGRCAAQAEQTPQAWFVVFDKETPQVKDAGGPTRYDFTFSVDKGAVDVATGQKLPAQPTKFERLEVPNDNAPILLFCQLERHSGSGGNQSVKFTPFGLCAGFGTDCNKITFDFVDQYGVRAELMHDDREILAESPSTMLIESDWQLLRTQLPAEAQWSLPSAKFKSSYLRLRTLLRRAVTLQRNFSVIDLLQAFTELGDEPTRKQLADRGALVFNSGQIVSEHSRKTEIRVRDTTLQQDITLALMQKVRIDYKIESPDRIRFDFVDRPVLIFQKLPAAFGGLTRFEVRSAVFRETQLDVSLKDPFSSREVLLQLDYTSAAKFVTALLLDGRDRDPASPRQLSGSRITLLN